MTFQIELLPKTPVGESPIGRICLNEHVESFEIDTQRFALQFYLDQWPKAVQQAVKGREITCFFTSISIDDCGFGFVFFYSLIPSELARGSDHYEVNGDGIYITEGFLSVTLDSQNFEKFPARISTIGNEPILPLHYFDPHKLEIFYLYLDSCISNISSWYLRNQDFANYLVSRRKP
jgi:hypothetical protein